MLQDISEDITFILLKNKIIDIEDRDIYVYGFQVILSTLIVTGSLLSLGVLLNKIPLTLGFMVTFISLRTYTGGYHAEKFKSCFTITMTIYLSQLLINIIIPDNFKKSIGIICIIIASLIIYRLTPVQHKNNPLSLKERNKYRRISRTITFFILISTLLVFYTNNFLVDFYFMISLTVVAVAILIIIPVLKGGEELE